MGLCISHLNLDKGKQEGEEEEQWYKMTPRIALITGCSTGIGLALAALLAKDPDKNFKVYATMRNPDKRGQLEEAAAECLGSTLFVEVLDVCSDGSVTQLVEKLIAKEGRIDILVNNAGVGLTGIMEMIPMDIARNVFETNFFGTMRLMRAVIPHMKARMEGHIVNISSVYGLMGWPFSEYYTASKFAVEGFSEAMGPTLKKFNVRLSVVQPGPVETAILSHVVELREKLDFSQADDRTKQLLEEVFLRLHNDWKTERQSAEEVAGMIKSVLQAHKPHFRYLTNDKFARSVLDAKFVDMSGDGVFRQISRRFFPEKN